MCEGLFVPRHLHLLLIALLAAPAAWATEPERIKLSEEHHYSRTEARERIKLLLDYWSKRFGVKRRWEGYTAFVEGRVMGVPFNGKVTVGEHEVSAITTDPGMFLRGTAHDYVRRKLQKYLHPT